MLFIRARSAVRAAAAATPVLLTVLPPPLLSWWRFRWALSVVMTRQNMIPDESACSQSVALVPGWDLINHCADGPMTTGFDVTKDALQYTANKTFAAGEEITMCYGHRSNEELLLYSGFCLPHNAYDTCTVHVQLPIAEMIDWKVRAMLLAPLPAAAAASSSSSSSSALESRDTGSDDPRKEGGFDARGRASIQLFKERRSEAEEAMTLLRALLAALAVTADKTELTALLRARPNDLDALRTAVGKDSAIVSAVDFLDQLCLSAFERQDLHHDESKSAAVPQAQAQAQAMGDADALGFRGFIQKEHVEAHVQLLQEVLYDITAT